MEEHCAASTSGRAAQQQRPGRRSTRGALCLLLLASLALQASAQWVVETNSFRIKEPSDAKGEYDAAIGDVRRHCPPPACLLVHAQKQGALF